MNYLIKHIKLLKPYTRLGFKIANEYKFQFVTNFISYILTIIIWVFFWDLIFGSIESIGHWNFPMLILVVAFFNLNDSIWQFTFYTMGVSYDIVYGEIDKYLTRPINPLYGIVMEHFEMLAIMPLLISLGIILFVVLKYFSFDILLFIIALLVTLICAMIFNVAYCTIGALSFWFGRTRSLITIYRSLFVTKSFPIDILNRFLRGFLTFVFPAIFIGTYPVLILTKLSLSDSLLILLLSIIVLSIFLIILGLVWTAGVKKYESFGG